MEDLTNIEYAAGTVIGYADYRTFKAKLDAELEQSAVSFVRIGYMLKIARDTDILAASGYKNVNDFAKSEYGLEKTQVSRFIRINDRFSEDGYSERLKAEYRNYGYAKLAIMLTLPDAANEILTPEYSKAEIQEFKAELDAEAEKTDIETILEGQNPVQQAMETNLDKAIHQLGHDAPELYTALYDAIGEGLKAVKDVLMPGGIKIYTVRPSGLGRMMLSLNEKKGVHLLIIRNDSKEEYTWEQLMDSIHAVMRPDWTAKESWEAFYDEEMPEKEEVAPVQQKAAKKESRIVPVRPEKQKKPAVQQSQEESAPKESTTAQEDTDEKSVDTGKNAGSNEFVEPVDETAEEDKKVSESDIEHGRIITERREKRIEELKEKKEFWRSSCETELIAIKNRMSMESWAKAAEMARAFADHADKIAELQNEIKDLRENIQMNIIDMEEQVKPEEGKEPEISGGAGGQQDEAENE